MDPQLSGLLDDLYLLGREHDAVQADRLLRWRNLEPDSAQLLAVLIRALAPKRLLELGTSNGYSTIWLADAAREAGGSLTSVELDPERSARAHENLRRAGLADHVQLRIEDAAAVLAGSAQGEWDFVLLDAERPAYAAYWPDLVRALAPGGLLVVDNASSHAHELTGFRELVARDQRVLEALAPTGAGMLLIVRVRD
jgi:predicted O-methyltransferase YrrM